MDNKPTCSIVVPVYNSQGSLRQLVKQLSEIMPEVASDFEIILVNDGSQDQSWQVINSLCEENSRIYPIELMRNFGQHNATLCGIRSAKFDVVITIDDDLQNPPEEIPLLLAKLKEGYDVVYGTPQNFRQKFWRSMASRVIRLVLRNLMGNEIAWQVSSFRAFHTSIREAFSNFTNPSVFIDVLLTWGAQKFTYLPVRQNSRPIGNSTYSFSKLLGLSINMITGFSTIPLRAATMIGFFFSLFGIGVLIYVLIRYFIVGGSIPGFPFLASVISIFSGAILFSLGIMGEYLGRIFTQSMGQSSYIIRKGEYK